jgi:nucleoside-diphosphate-sugar epimerase
MSTVAIAGGHGKIAMLLGRVLAERGDVGRGLIRNPAQEDDLRAAGIEPVLCDLESGDDVAAAVRGADAVVFAAGAGPGSGAGRKNSMDLGGAVKLIEAAKAEGISRYLMVSAMGAAELSGADASGAAESAGDEDAEPSAEQVFAVYMRAKAAADDALRASGLDYTVVRPGGLTDDPGTGLVTIAERLDRGQVPRADVAAVLLACLDTPGTIGRSFDLLAGDTPIADALAG